MHGPAEPAAQSLTASADSILLNPANHDLLALTKAVRNGAVYGTKIRFPHALVMTLLFRKGTPRQKILSIFNATRQHARNLALFAFIYKGLLLVFRGVSTQSLPQKWTKSRSMGNGTVSPHATFERKLTSRESSGDSFFAGLVAGYVVFGRQPNSSVAQQIVIYVFARVCLGFAKLAVMPRTPRAPAMAAGYGEVRPPGGGLLDLIFGDPTSGRGGLVPGVWSDDKRELYAAMVRKNSWGAFASVSWALVMWLFRWHPDVLQPSLRSSMVYLYDNAEEWDGFKNWIWHNR